MSYIKKQERDIYVLITISLICTIINALLLIYELTL